MLVSPPKDRSMRMKKDSADAGIAVENGVFLLRNAEAEYLADGVHRWLNRGSASTFAARIQNHFAGQPPPLVDATVEPPSGDHAGRCDDPRAAGRRYLVGAVPFNPLEDDCLFEPRQLLRRPAEQSDRSSASSTHPTASPAVRGEPGIDSSDSAGSASVGTTSAGSASVGTVSTGTVSGEPLSGGASAVAGLCRCGAATEIRAIPSGQQYADSVGQTAALLAAAGTGSAATDARLADGQAGRASAATGSSPLGKVVLARSLEIATAEPVDPWELVRRLPADPHATTFLTSLPDQPAGDRGDALAGERSPVYLAGATPELLVSRRGLQVYSNPLAGSAPRSSDPLADRAAADELLLSTKDLHEHRFVVQAIEAALRPFCRWLQVPDRPELQATATMWHLGTRITAELLDPSISVGQLVAAIHPTPAVCGTPTPLALQTILQTEAFSRGFYAGAVGWMDDQGDGDWYVAIRCAQLQSRSIRLFAGAGIVADSDPATELAETTAKLETWFRTLGIAAQNIDR